ncbi:MAG: hypothetical protein AAGI49_16095, partial [Bacteroidota bacterium]
DEIINEEGEQESVPLPIITIYFLGHNLEHIKLPVLKVNNCYYDPIRDEVVELEEKEPFIELLHHESYTIQIRRLKNELATRLERVLMVFSQEFRLEDQHKLKIPDEVNDPLTQRIIRRLSRAIGDEEVRKKMRLEDEMLRIYNREMKGLVDTVLEQGQEIEANKQLIKEKDQALEEKDQTIQELLERLKRLEEQ